jgi:hypothetical protein
VDSTRSEVCWAAIPPDDRYVYVTNFGDGAHIELHDRTASQTNSVEANPGALQLCTGQTALRHWLAITADPLATGV